MKGIIKNGFSIGDVKLMLQVTVISYGMEQQRVNKLLADMESLYHALFIEESGQGGGACRWQQDSPLR